MRAALRLAVLTTSTCLAVGCGDGGGASSSGEAFRLVTPADTSTAVAVGTAAAGAKAVHKAPITLLAHDAAALGIGHEARGVIGQETTRLVAFADDGVVPDFRDGLMDAVVTASIDVMAEQAADLTLLAVSGVEIPARVAVGARWYSRANRAAGGQATPSPDEFGIAALRMQHAAVLDKQPKTDVVFRIGVVISATEPMRARLATALTKALRAYPQLEVTMGGDAAAFVTENRNAILFVGRGQAAYASLAKDARAQGIRVLGVASDLPTSAVQSEVLADAESFGTAAGEAIRALQPAGTTVLELGFRSDDAALVARRTALLRTLQASTAK
ncbi:MAG: hypothetical protein RL398_2954 [Planctomycetota bacterium]